MRGEGGVIGGRANYGARRPRALLNSHYARAHSKMRLCIREEGGGAGEATAAGHRAGISLSRLGL